MSVHQVSSTSLQYVDDNFELSGENISIYIPWDIQTPSEAEGMTLIEERKIRIFCTGLIQEAGILLKLPQICILTGMLIFNRFYWRKSFQKTEPFNIACASLFVATKVEESFRKLRDLVSVFFHLIKKKENIKPVPILEITSDYYSNMKNSVILMEMHILKELGFQVYSLNEHPHKLMKSINLLLKGNPGLVRKAWNYLNDSYRTICCVCFRPNVLACSAIYLAARMTYFSLPKAEFWEIFDTKFEDIQDVCSEILGLYNFGKIELKEVYEILNKFDSNLNVENGKKEEKENGKIEEKEKEKDKEKDKEKRNKKVESSHKKRSRSRSRSKERSRKMEKHSKHNHKKHKSRKRSYSSVSSRSISSGSRSSSSSYSRKKNKKKDRKHKKPKRKYSKSSSSRSVRYSPIKLSSPKFDKKVVNNTKNVKK